MFNLFLFYKFIFQAFHNNFVLHLDIEKNIMCALPSLFLRLLRFFSPRTRVVQPISGVQEDSAVFIGCFKIYRAHGARLFICSSMASIFGNGLKGQSWYVREVRFLWLRDPLLAIRLEHRHYFHRRRGIWRRQDYIGDQTVLYFTDCALIPYCITHV